jgi:hypothetical protein
MSEKRPTASEKQDIADEERAEREFQAADARHKEQAVVKRPELHGDVPTPEEARKMFDERPGLDEIMTTEGLMRRGGHIDSPPL